MRKLGIEEAMQVFERLANLDVEGLPRELGLEGPLKSRRAFPMEERVKETTRLPSDLTG